MTLWGYWEEEVECMGMSCALAETRTEGKRPGGGKNDVRICGGQGKTTGRTMGNVGERSSGQRCAVDFRGTEIKEEGDSRVIRILQREVPVH